MIGGAVRTGRFAGQLLTRIGAEAIPNAVARAAPAIACRLTSVQRMVQPAQAYYNIGTMTSNFSVASQAIASGDYETAAALIARSGGMIRGTLSSLRESTRLARAAGSAGFGSERLSEYLRACFAAGTPILWEGGVKNVEDFRVGDKVWARDENDPNGPLALKEIEECFDRTGRILHLHVGAQVIRTSDEHPFWVEGRGWTPACALLVGDLLVGRDGESVPVEDLLDTGQYETVYNFRVADFHTYFVGDIDWGFSLWAHNACTAAQLNRARDRVQEMVDASVPGAQRLLRQLNSNQRYMSGYTFEAERAYAYWRRGRLQAVEARVSHGNLRRVDMRLADGLRVESKSWTNFQYFSPVRQQDMVNRLREQIGAYLQTPGSRLRVEFDQILPQQVQDMLDVLKVQFGNRLTWRTVR